MRRILYGGGEHGEVVRNILFKLGISIDFVYDDFVLLDNQISFDEILNGDLVYLGIGSVEGRKKVLEKKRSWEFQSVSANDCTTPLGYPLLEGTIIGERSVVGINVVLGRGVLVNTSAVVEHGCRVGDCTEISVGALLGGGVVVGKETFIGMGSVIRDHITIGDNCFISMGTVLTENIPSNTKVTRKGTYERL